MAMTPISDDERDPAQTALPAAKGASRRDVTRPAVPGRYRQKDHTHRVQASSDRLIDNWADVLERLETM